MSGGIATSAVWQYVLVTTGNPDLLETALMWAIPGYVTLWGLAAVRGSWSGWKRARRIEDTPTATARAATMGRTELTGTVEPAGETLTQPFVDEECVYARWATKTGGPIVTMDAQGSSTAVVGGPDVGERAVPFYVDDGTGNVLIDVDDDPTVELHEDSRLGTTASRPDERDDRVGEFLRAEYPAGAGERRAEQVALRQDVIEPGDEVYVYGGARETSGEATAVIGTETETGRFLISDRPEEELTEGFQAATGGGPMGLKMGAGLLVVGFFWLLVAAAGVRFTMPVLVGAGILTQIAALGSTSLW